MPDKVYVGNRVSDLDIGETAKHISKVVLHVGEIDYISGNDTGLTIERELQWGSQALADKLVQQLSEAEYQGYNATDALLDPAAEIGDGIVVGGVYSVLAQADIEFDRLYTARISAPINDEIEDEYPYINKQTRTANAKIAGLHSYITKETGRISLRVEEINVENHAYTNSQLADYATGVQAQIDHLQDQIDGVVDTWFYDYVPTTSNYPASSWNTDALKNEHLGDIFYVVNDPDHGGEAYRWSYINGIYSWQILEDDALAQALQIASQAQATADSKMRVFVEQPVPPYDVGDLWAQGPNGDIMRCTTARATGSYTATDWTKASRYTDDSALNTFLLGDYADDIAYLHTLADTKIETFYQDESPATNWITEQDRLLHTGDIWQNTFTGQTYRWNGAMWQELKTTPPDAVFDRIDGKAQVFITTPQPPYQVGDLWFRGASYDIYTCTTARATGSYRSADWVKRNKYTDDTVANTALAEIAIERANILLKVAKDEVIASINLSEEDVTINAEKVNLTGYVTISGLAGGTTTIDGSCIKTGSISASYISGGTLDASKMTVSNLSASSITSGSLSASRISGGTLNGNSMTVSNLSASSITGGTLDASKVTVTNLSADSIKTGTLDASQVTITNLEASNIHVQNIYAGSSGNYILAKSSGTTTAYFGGDGTWNVSNTYLYANNTVYIGQYNTSNGMLIIDTTSRVIRPASISTLYLWDLGSSSYYFRSVYARGYDIASTIISQSTSTLARSITLTASNYFEPSATNEIYLGSSSRQFLDIYTRRAHICDSSSSALLSFFGATGSSKFAISLTSNNAGYSAVTANNYLYALNSLIGILKNKYGLIA